MTTARTNNGIASFIFYLLLWSNLVLPRSLYGQTATADHGKRFSDINDLASFFALDKGPQVIISGHRGSTESGLAENSIEAFDTVLSHHFAFFEVDPRLTKDSVIVLMHDATLDRTTSGTGKLADRTWDEVKSLRLKDRNGQLTDCRIPTLKAAIAWATGKTILNLDKKDVPLPVMAKLLRDLGAANHVMVTVHSPAEALFYRNHFPDQMLSVHAKTEQALQQYIDSGLEMRHMIVYIGSQITPANKALYRKLSAMGIRAMISASSSYDKHGDASERAQAYRAIQEDGATVIESDFPMEVSRALDIK
ncbi:MAG TPA: glycerophosphodiester phosphodiesterase family protein [Sphingobacterium sp.]|nr:glycerophosphodiester phosphodiesterase family protein [Sphingobacterium sp.]